MTRNNRKPDAAAAADVKDDIRTGLAELAAQVSHMSASLQRHRQVRALVLTLLSFGVAALVVTAVVLGLVVDLIR